MKRILNLVLYVIVSGNLKPLWAQQQAEVVLPEIKVEVEPGELPAWESVRPSLPPLNLPPLQPELPPLPAFDPTQPRWNPPPLLVLPQEEGLQRPSFFSEKGVRGLMLLGLGGPYLSVFAVQAEQRDNDFNTLVGFYATGRDLGFEQASTTAQFNLRFGSQTSQPWWWTLDLERQNQPLWGQSQQGYCQITQHKAATQFRWAFDSEARLGLQGNGNYADRNFTEGGPDDRQFEAQAGFWFDDSPTPQWKLGLSANGGVLYHHNWQDEVLIAPLVKANLSLSYLSPFWGFHVSSTGQWLEELLGQGRLELQFFPLPWDFTLFGQYDQLRTLPTQTILAPERVTPVDRRVEAGARVNWASRVDEDVWMRAFWQISYQWGLEHQRWLLSPNPLGLAQVTSLSRNRQLSQLGFGIKGNAVDLKLDWQFDFLSPANGEAAHQLGASVLALWGPLSLGSELSWESASGERPIVSALFRFAPLPNLEFEARAQDLLFVTEPGVSRKDAFGFRTPGFGAYLAARYIW
jgi:hypothetical protein